MTGSGEGRASRRGGDSGLWFDIDQVHWFPTERRRRGVVPSTVPSRPAAVAAMAGSPLLAGAGGATGTLAGPGAFRRPAPARAPGWSPQRKRRFATRFMPAATLAVVAAGAAPWVLQDRAERFLPVPPAAFTAPATTVAHTPAASIPVATLQAAAQAVQAPARTAAAEPAMPEIAWRASRAIGAPHAGRLAGGVGLPVSGPGWTTWDPARDRVPNRAGRLYGTDRLVRMVLTVLEGYHAAHPNAPRVVIGDLSRRGGGPIDQHVSHQNGLDVDVYFPRRDGKLKPPARVAQIDRRLAQDLVDRFVAAGAQMMFVGPSTGLRGPSGVVLPYPNHDDHVHVRIAAG